MAHTENQKKLLKILNEIFQLDQSDLDFGIYRIMNTKSKEIREFLENDLIESVKNAYSPNDNNSIQKELDEDHYKVKLIEQEFKGLMFNE
jgi:adenine-specific DNA-methyltransferase